VPRRLSRDEEAREAKEEVRVGRSSLAGLSLSRIA